MSKLFLFRTLIAALAVTTAVAATETPAAGGSDRRLAASENRENQQDQRIANGISNGSISSAEAARLNAQQAHIDRTQTRLAADGNFSRRDYARTDYRQDRARGNINRARFNRR